MVEIYDKLFEKSFLAVTSGNASVLLGSHMYTNMADSDQVFDDSLERFKVVLGSVEGV